MSSAALRNAGVEDGPTPSTSPVFDAAAGQVELHQGTPCVPTPTRQPPRAGRVKVEPARLARGTRVALTRPSTVAPPRPLVDTTSMRKNDPEQTLRRFEPFAAKLGKLDARASHTLVPPAG